jgi:hypothetical protein
MAQQKEADKVRVCWGEEVSLILVTPNIYLFIDISGRQEVGLNFLQTMTTRRMQ